VKSEQCQSVEAKFSLVAEYAQELNVAIEAVEAAMQTKTRAAKRDDDTLFFAGAELSPGDDQAMADFAYRLNWNIVYVAYSQDAMRAGCASITKISCYLPLSGEQVAFMHHGRLWQARDAGRLAIVFPEVGAMLRLSSRGHLTLMENQSKFEAAGFDRARFAVARHRSRGRLSPAVFSSVGHVPIVHPLASVLKGASAA
jgi:hypothetical protein